MEYSAFELKKVIDIHLLQEIQQHFAEITGLAFVTVDFRGNPITKETNFSQFCLARRRIPEYKLKCYFSDAHAGLEAAIRNAPYIFRCPAGLTDFAVPIVVKGQYLGAVLSGQVRCLKLEAAASVGTEICSDEKSGNNKELVEKFLLTSEMEYDKLVATAQLLYVVINQLVEKEVINIVQEELNEQRLHLMHEKKARVELEQELQMAELTALKAQMNPHFLFNVLNSISCFALMEGAEKTQEMAHLFSQILRYNIESVDGPVSLRSEMEYIEKYLKVQQLRFADKMEYQMVLIESLDDFKIPPMIIQPFVENAVNHGIFPKEAAGKIIVEVTLDKNDIIIHIKDNGVGIKPRRLEQLMGIQSKRQEGKDKCIGIGNTRKRLLRLFGKEYDIQIRSRLHEGTCVEIRLPQEWEEKG